jgi:mannan endo-1,4-beta-mannosidase
MYPSILNYRTLMRQVKTFYSFILLIITCLSCSQDDYSNNNVAEQTTDPFTISGPHLLYNNEITFYKGVNAMQTFGLVDPGLMNEWKVEIVREFVGNLREQPIDSDPIQASDNKWYHSLQTIVNQNRDNNKITIICPFGWVDNEGHQILFTGLNPSSQYFYADYKTKMKEIAEHFKGQPDVWIEVWNEPYHWNNENNYTHNLWLSDMTDMVENLRQVPGFRNIVIVPGNEQGQSEEAILAKGNTLIEDKFNVLFDLHAYEKWLVNTTESQIISRLNNLKENDIPFFIGEIGVKNVGDIMPIQNFLNAVNSEQVSTLAWLWNQNSNYSNALLTNDGLPNSNFNNNYWGLTYKEFLDD